VMSRRSWNRRESSVTSNGFFTVLRSDRWFSAMRLPGVSRYLAGQSKGTASPQANGKSTENPAAAPPPESTSVQTPGHAEGQEMAILSRSMIPSAHDRFLIRPALIVLAASAITLLLLWWIP
jgi:hypothetical protein